MRTRRDTPTTGQNAHQAPGSSCRTLPALDSFITDPARQTTALPKPTSGPAALASVHSEERDGLQHFLAEIDEFRLFDTPVPWKEGPPRNAQTSIQPITRVQFERLLAHGMNGGEACLSMLTRCGSRGAAWTQPRMTRSTPRSCRRAQQRQARDPDRAARNREDDARPGGRRSSSGRQPLLGLHADHGHGRLDDVRDDRRPATHDHRRTRVPRGAFPQARSATTSGWSSTSSTARTSTAPSASSSPSSPASPSSCRTSAQAHGTPADARCRGQGSTDRRRDVLEIPQSWRIIATMNVFDKTLLFEMSFALMRRFAFVEVPSPSRGCLRGSDRPRDGRRRRRLRTLPNASWSFASSRISAQPSSWT